MWSELHNQFHSNAQAYELRKRKRCAGGDPWYLEFAAKLKAEGKTSKEDVLECVTRWYVYESKRGFDKFAVTRVFWAVWSIVSASDAHAALLESVRDSIRV